MFQYMEKETKTILIIIAAVLLLAACLVAVFHIAFYYNPEKTELTITAIQENFNYRAEYKLDGNTLTTTIGKFKKETKVIALTKDEVREVFRYIVKRKMFFLSVRNFDKRVKVTWDEIPRNETPMLVPDTFYYVTVKFNNIERTLGGFHANQYKKIGDIFRCIEKLAGEL